MINRGRLYVSSVALGLLLAACGGNDSADQAITTAENGGSAASEGTAQPALEDISGLLASADVDRGKTLFFQCRACHSLTEGAAHKVGPNLHGMFGRKAGVAEGFAYSDVLKNSDIVWNTENMNEWLARPSQFLPGNLMVFVGVKKPEDRASLIKFLQQATE